MFVGSLMIVHEKHYKRLNKTIQLLRRQVSRNLPMKLLLKMINES